MYWSLFRRSSAVEQLTVNQLVVGSIPTAGANKNNSLAHVMLSFFFAWVTSGLQKNITFKIIISTHFSDIFYQLI
jgi:hypothetical protein